MYKIFWRAGGREEVTLGPMPSEEIGRKQDELEGQREGDVGPSDGLHQCYGDPWSFSKVFSAWSEKARSVYPHFHLCLGMDHQDRPQPWEGDSAAKENPERTK